MDTGTLKYLYSKNLYNNKNKKFLKEFYSKNKNILCKTSGKMSR